MKKIAVLMGGWSQEREISILSSKSVSSILRDMGYEVSEIDVKKDLKYITDELYKANPDFVFNMLHGIGGEDGVIQGVLEIFGVPYSNSGVVGSAISFDKAICKKIASARGVRVVEGFEIHKDDIYKLGSEIKIGPLSEPTISEEVLEVTEAQNPSVHEVREDSRTGTTTKLPERGRLEYPFVVKAASNGSSVGVFLIFNEEDLNKVKNTEWTFGDKVLVEKYIKGREFTVLVANGKTIGAVEITFKNKCYDYESKYEIGGSTHISSFELNESAIKEMYAMAEKVFEACCCKGIARADFRYDNENVYFLEINTQPGMTELSLAPDIARFKGISFGDLLKMNF